MSIIIVPLNWLLSKWLSQYFLGFNICNKIMFAFSFLRSSLAPLSMAKLFFVTEKNSHQWRIYTYAASYSENLKISISRVNYYLRIYAESHTFSVYIWCQAAGKYSWQCFPCALHWRIEIYSWPPWQEFHQRISPSGNLPAQTWKSANGRMQKAVCIKTV